MEVLAELLGEKIVHRELMGVGDRAVNMAPALREVGRFWMDVEREVFDSSGASGGKPWAPTKAGNQPLVNTGSLLASLTEEGAADQIFEVNDDVLVFGTGHPAARFHHTGTKHMDARPPVQINPTNRRRTVKILQRFLVEGQVGRSL